MIEFYSLGIDSGAVSMKFVLFDEDNNLVYSSSKKNHGDLIKTLRSGLESLSSDTNKTDHIKTVGVTGSGRQLIGSIINANAVKNEITAHLTGTLFYYPDAQTIIEIGGQDSKIIILEDGIPIDFEMSGVCGSGTGSFLEQQAARLGVELSEFGNLVKECDQNDIIPCHFGGGCGIFIESAMIRCQQMGKPLPQIIAGLCNSVVSNYLFDTAKGKKIIEPVLFQGGVAANKGIQRSFESKLNLKVIVPDYFLFMGAIGAAFLGKEQPQKAEFSFLKIREILTSAYRTKEFVCEECEKLCNLTEIGTGNSIITTLGKRCN